METMKMIADWRNNTKPEGTREYEDIPTEELDHNNDWYLHGELESFVQFDKAYVTNCLSGGFSKETINYAFISGDEVKEVSEYKPKHAMCVDGVVDVEIEGIDKPCIGYFWTDDYRTVYYQEKPYQVWRQRGLVCFADDEKGCEYAKQKLRERAKFL